jgi:hypothetical protein
MKQRRKVTWCAMIGAAFAAAAERVGETHR